jgi:hypothetical protein
VLSHSGQHRPHAPLELTAALLLLLLFLDGIQKVNMILLRTGL